MLKPKLWYFCHLMQTDDSLEKPMMLGKIESRTIKKAEHPRTDAFELWYRRRLPKEIKPVNLKGNQP